MAIGSKIIKPGGSDPDDFEKSIAQALVELEANSDLKPYLRDLHITRAREIEFGSKKVNSIWRTCEAFNSNPLTHSLHAGRHHLRAHSTAEGVPEDPDHPGPRAGEEVLGQARRRDCGAQDPAQAHAQGPQPPQAEASTLQDSDRCVRRHP